MKASLHGNLWDRVTDKFTNLSISHLLFSQKIEAKKKGAAGKGHCGICQFSFQSGEGYPGNRRDL
jgi:hypothetical protein